MALQRMDNVLIVVDDLEAAKAFFAELGMELEGEATNEGPSVDQVIGLDDVRCDIARAFLVLTPGNKPFQLSCSASPMMMPSGPRRKHSR